MQARGAVLNGGQTLGLQRQRPQANRALASRIPQPKHRRFEGLVIDHHDATGQMLRRLLDQPDFRTMAFSPDGRRLAGAGIDGTVRIWDAGSGTEQAVLAGHTGGVRAVAFSPDGRRLAGAGDDGTVRLWDLSGRRCESALRLEAPLAALAWTGVQVGLAVQGRVVVLRFVSQ